MNSAFFQSISPLLAGVDLTLNIKAKDGLLTISVLPRPNSDTLKTSDLSPVLLTGSPQEIDEGFLAAIKEPITSAAGLTVHLSDFKESLDKTKSEKESDLKKEVSKSKSSSKTSPKKSSPKKKPKVPIIKKIEVATVKTETGHVPETPPNELSRTVSHKKTSAKKVSSKSSPPVEESGAKAEPISVSEGAPDRSHDISPLQTSLFGE
ncbi:MAG: PRTRC system protein E [Cytophagales bacterium]|nr:PRTRC system protein E [Cytophagales bacterium]